MARFERVISQGESLSRARTSVNDEVWRRVPSVSRTGSRGNQQVCSWRVQRIDREPESAIGHQSETQRGQRSPPSLRRECVGPRRILLVHGLGPDYNCDKIFNLFCLYGNVTAVKILRDNQVLVELYDAEDADRCLSNLHLLPLDENNKLKVKYSKHSYIYDNGTVRRLSDGTPAQKNYETSKFHRFSTKKPCAEQRRRIVAPSKFLHFFNAPLDIDCSVIQTAVTNALGCNDAVRSITILPHKQPGAKCSTGLIELKSINLAAKTILLLNHTTFDSSRSRFPFVMKICFSKWSEFRPKFADSCSLIFSTTPRNPWLLHKSEQIGTTSELLVSQMTPVPCGNCPWTLWDLRRSATEAMGPVEAGSPPETEFEHHDQVEEPAVGAGQAAGDA